jgi:hypothetical protein
VVPRERFLVPLHVIEAAVEKIREEAITQFIDDTATTRLVDRSS